MGGGEKDADEVVSLLTLFCLIRSSKYLVYDDVGQGAEVTVMLEFPQ